MVEPATVKKQITTEISSRQVTLGAGQTTATFDATVYNDSDRFASFQVKLVAAGELLNTGKPWYRLTPSVSSKIPAGDCTRFQVEIFDLPPIAQQFRGVIDLTVEVTSRELNDQYDRQPLRLVAEGLQAHPPDVVLMPPMLQGTPGERVTIAAQIRNTTPASLDMTLRLYGLPESCFPEGTQRTLSLPPGKTERVVFPCELPPPMQLPSQLYPLRLETTGRFPSVTATGQFQILPAGILTFGCDPLEQSIPEALGRWQNPSQGTATFALQFQNQSNVEPPVQITVRDLQANRRRWFWQKAPDDSPDPAVLPDGVTLGDLPGALPIGNSAASLRIQRRLPWLGWSRSQKFEVTAQTVDSPIPLQEPTQTVQVHLFPVIPLWQQILWALLLLGLGALAWVLLAEPKHQGPVNAVQFSGQGTEVLSGSDDQTIRRWRVQNDRLRTQSRIGDLGKAVRVARYRPINNDQVALGFENGEIQLANLLTGDRSRLTPDRDDRVFALVFSRDARTLYSGHGSGLVLQWDISQFLSEQTDPKLAYNLQFAIEAMTLVGSETPQLAIAGRYNRLLLLDLASIPDKPKTQAGFSPIDLTYPSGGSTDYISSLSTAEQIPTLLAVADTQGRISLWDTDTCRDKKGRCDPLDQPWLGHGGAPVRSVALSANGCFLASAGDDGQVKLWALDGQGVRRSSELEGRVLGRSKSAFNTVDVIQTRRAVWITSGDDDGQVQLYQVRFEGDRPSDRCPVLAGGSK